MKIFDVRTWGITTQLVIIALVPACLMFIFTNFYLYQAAREEVVQDVRSQGDLIASSLAQSSVYALVSGNTQLLEKSLARLVTTHHGVQSIRIDDADGHQVLTVGRPHEGGIKAEASVEFERLDMEAFDGSAPHVSIGAPLSERTKLIGRVVVLMSAEPILALKSERLIVATLIVLISAMASGAIGLAMALRLRRPLRGFVNALRQIGQGDYEIERNVKLRGELASIQEVIAVMASALKRSRRELEDQVRQRTTELRQALEMANDANEDKRRLINRVHEAIEDERRRIALEIHDSFNASIVTIRLWTDSILDRVVGDQETSDLAQRIMDALQDLYQSARHLITQMHPEVLDTIGLRGAIEEMVRKLDDAHPRCRFTLHVDGDFPVLRDARAMVVYRLVQEALSNVIKHSGASLAQVILSLDAESVIHLTVEDDGHGFDVGNRSGAGTGLIGMRERVSGAAGDLRIESMTTGTRIFIDLPPGLD